MSLRESTGSLVLGVAVDSSDHLTFLIDMFIAYRIWSNMIVKLVYRIEYFFELLYM